MFDRDSQEAHLTNAGFGSDRLGEASMKDETLNDRRVEVGIENVDGTMTMGREIDFDLTVAANQTSSTKKSATGKHVSFKGEPES